jgi:GT2 family glycosyltransferase/glycosyltransferase involved in cell wall biosynthesis
LKVSILTLFHEASDVSRQYLDYWRRHHAALEEVELLFGDNGSQGETADLVLDAQVWARTFHFGSNLGFAAGNNRLAAEAKGEILVFLNNDTIPCESWLEEILRVFTARKEVNIVGNLQLSVATRLVDHAGVYFNAKGEPYHFRPPVGGLSRLRWMPVPAVTGACLAIRRDCFNQLKGFDEAYLNGYEDTDLCLRARGLGGDILIATRSHVWHHVSASPGRHRFDDANAELFGTHWQSRVLELSGWVPPQLDLNPARPCPPLRYQQTLQVFLPTVDGYSETQSIHRPYPKNRWTRISLELPPFDNQNGLPLRLDPSKRCGATRIGGLAIRNPHDSRLLWQLKGPALNEHVLATGTGIPLSDGEVGILSTGDDPQLLISLPDEFRCAKTPLSLSIWLYNEEPPVPKPGLSQVGAESHILIDLWRLVPGGANGGVKVLALEILTSLQAIPELRNRLFCVIQEGLLPEVGHILPRNQISVLSETEYQSPPSSLLSNFEVLYSPVHSSTLWRPGMRRISTVVDLLHRDFPQSLPPEELYHRERCMIETLANSDFIQCNSLFVKEGLRHHYGMENERLFVLYNAVQHRVARHRNAERVCRPRPYFIYPANTWKHKNHQRLLEAYQAYRKSTTNPWDLCLTGSKVGGPNEGLPDTLPLPEGCEWLGFVDEHTYVSLFQGASAMIFPSLYEGFGIPVLEALFLGVPTACSRSCSLPEIGGNLVHYMDAESVPDITRALQALSRGRRHTARAMTQYITEKFRWKDEIYRLQVALT